MPEQLVAPALRETSMDAFFRQASTIAFVAADHGKHSLYERLKGMFVARFPGATPEEYEWAMLRLARMAGV